MDQSLTGIIQGYHKIIRDYEASRRKSSLKSFRCHFLHYKAIGTGQEARLQQAVAKFLTSDTA